MKKKSHSSYKNGFTLVELLVVIGIIALLAGLLFPVFASVKARAKKNTSVSNLKQMYTSIQIYSVDYNDRLVFGVPRADSIDYSVPKDLYDIAIVAPVVEDQLEKYDFENELNYAPGDDSDFKYFGTSYSLRRRATLLSYTLTQYEESSEEPLAWELGIYYDKNNYMGYSPSRNVLYFDGSVRWVNQSKFLERLGLPE